MEYFTIGMLFNFCYADTRLTKKINGEHVSDPEEQYRKLKKLQPEIEKLHKDGKITEDKYKSFMKSITDYEREEE